MKRTKQAALPTQSSETTEELIGVLTAISVVSKRLAKKLALMEPPERSEDAHGSGQAAASD